MLRLVILYKVQNSKFSIKNTKGYKVIRWKSERPYNFPIFKNIQASQKLLQIIIF